jgi:transcriptional regulator with XRE-family HTH domain
VSPTEFRLWRDELGLSQQAAADVLGMSKGSIELYERGSRRDDNRQVVIPTTVELACKYLAQRVRLQRRLEMLESGKMTSRDGSSMADTTAEWAEELRRWITEIDSSLAEAKNWHEPAAVSERVRNALGAFQVIEIELEQSGAVLGRRRLGVFETKDGAEVEARRLSERFEQHHGYDKEHGYWWGRDPDPSRIYRYLVETPRS